MEGITFRELVKEKGVTFGWLCDRLDISRTTLSKYLDNPRQMKVEHLVKIADLFYISRGGMLTIILKEN